MSTALTYREPYRVSAGVLALLVHLAFFAVLYFGVHWQSRPNEEFMVDVWQSLPDTEVAPPQPAPPPAAVEPAPPARVVAPVSPPAKADIEMRTKKSKKAEQKEKQAKLAAREKAAAKARQEAAAKEKQELEQWAAQQQAVRTQVRAEVSQATQVQVERYQDMIRNKIRRKIVKMDVPPTTEVEFEVTLLPDGMLMDDPVLRQSSGNAAYDDNVARAIMASEPLPVPSDPSLQKMFRKLKLKIRPQ